jgi:hypothetical protein
VTGTVPRAYSPASLCAFLRHRTQDIPCRFHSMLEPFSVDSRKVTQILGLRNSLIRKGQLRWESTGAFRYSFSQLVSTPVAIIEIGVDDNGIAASRTAPLPVLLPKPLLNPSVLDHVQIPLQVYSLAQTNLSKLRMLLTVGILDTLVTERQFSGGQTSPNRAILSPLPFVSLPIDINCLTAFTPDCIRRAVVLPS